MTGILVAANREWHDVREYFQDSIREMSACLYGGYEQKGDGGTPQ